MNANRGSEKRTEAEARVLNGLQQSALPQGPLVICPEIRPILEIGVI